MRIGISHYLLSCYVGRTGAQLQPSVSTYSVIFQRRPSGCRYAVAQPIHLQHEGGIVTSVAADYWIAWDLYATTRPDPQFTLRAPEPIWTGPTEDALIMKAIALYDQPIT